MDKKEIFLLTKSHHSDRTMICPPQRGHSENFVLYLAGDEVYNMFETASVEDLTRGVMACKEDLEARGGVGAGDRVIVPEDFYKLLVEDMMQKCSKIHIF